MREGAPGTLQLHRKLPDWNHTRYRGPTTVSFARPPPPDPCWPGRSSDLRPRLHLVLSTPTCASLLSPEPCPVLPDPDSPRRPPRPLARSASCPGRSPRAALAPLPAPQPGTNPHGRASVSGWLAGGGRAHPWPLQWPAPAPGSATAPPPGARPPRARHFHFHAGGGRGDPPGAERRTFRTRPNPWRTWAGRLVPQPPREPVG